MQSMRNVKEQGTSATAPGDRCNCPLANLTSPLTATNASNIWCLIRVQMSEDERSIYRR